MAAKRVHRQLPPRQELEELALGPRREGSTTAGLELNVKRPEAERPLCGDRRVQLPQAASRRVAGVGKGGLARRRPARVELLEAGKGEIYLAADLHPLRRSGSRTPQAERNLANGTQIPGDGLADHSVAARCPFGQDAVLVGEGDGESIDLRLDHVARAANFARDPRVARFPSPQLLRGEGVVEGEHGDEMFRFLEAACRLRPHPKRGGVGGPQLWMIVLEIAELPKESVVLRIGEGGAVEDVILVVRPPQDLAQLGGAGREFFRCPAAHAVAGISDARTT